MTNFKVIERDDSFYEDADKFIELYYDKTIKKPDILRKLNISEGQYRRLRKYCIEYKGLKAKLASNDNPKYYNKAWNGKYNVRKTIGKNNVSYGYYDTPEIAEAVVRELIKVNWNKKELARIQKEVLE